MVDTTKWLTVYRKPKAISKKQKVKEYYHLRKAMGKRVFTPYNERTEEQLIQLRKDVYQSIKKRRQTDPKFRKLELKRRLLLKKRQRQRESGKLKFCNSCSRIIPHVDIELRQGSDKYAKTPRHECKTCRKERNRLYYLENKDKHKTDGEWNTVLKRKLDDN